MSEPARALFLPAEARRFLRFVAVGIVNTLFGYAVFTACIIAGIDPQLALLVATILGVLFNFLTTGRLVFKSRDAGRLPRFVLAYLVLYGFNALSLRSLIGLGWAAVPAQALILPFMVVATYVTMKGFVFRKTTS